jgi:site-specific recombinase XerD
MWVIGVLLYGSGLRLEECLELTLGVKSPADRLMTVPRGQLAAPPRSSNEGH